MRRFFGSKIPGNRRACRCPRSIRFADRRRPRVRSALSWRRCSSIAFPGARPGRLCKGSRSRKPHRNSACGLAPRKPPSKHRDSPGALWVWLGSGASVSCVCPRRCAFGRDIHSFDGWASAFGRRNGGLLGRGVPPEPGARRCCRCTRCCCCCSRPCSRCARCSSSTSSGSEQSSQRLAMHVQ